MPAHSGKGGKGSAGRRAPSRRETKQVREAIKGLGKKSSSGGVKGVTRDVRAVTKVGKALKRAQASRPSKKIGGR